MSHPFNWILLIYKKNTTKMLFCIQQWKQCILESFSICVKGEIIYIYYICLYMHKETGRIYTYKRRKWLSIWEGRQMGDRKRSKITFNAFWRALKNIPKWKWLIKELLPCTVWTQDMNKWQTQKGERREEEPTTMLSSVNISFWKRRYYVQHKKTTINVSYIVICKFISLA